MKKRIGGITLRERQEMCATIDCGECGLKKACGFYQKRPAGDIAREEYEKEVEWPEAHPCETMGVCIGVKPGIHNKHKEVKS